MNTLEDLLSPLDAETLKSLLTPEKLRMRGLVPSFFKFSIPLERNQNSRVKALIFKPLTSNSGKILVGLFWNILFGRKFKVYHWYILFAVLIRTIEKGSQSRNLLKLLVISTSSEGKTWQSSMKPIKTILTQLHGKDTAEGMITEILKHLPYELPKKGPIIEELLEVKVDSLINKKPTDPRRIGVGYKDKGSLGNGAPEPESPEFFLEQIDAFDFLLRQVKNEIPEFFR